MHPPAAVGAVSGVDLARIDTALLGRIFIILGAAGAGNFLHADLPAFALPIPLLTYVNKDIDNLLLLLPFLLALLSAGL